MARMPAAPSWIAHRTRRQPSSLLRRGELGRLTCRELRSRVRTMSKLGVIDLLAAALLAGIKAYLLGKYGISNWQESDGNGYVLLAEEMTKGTMWLSLEPSSLIAPLSLFRLPGYSA